MQSREHMDRLRRRHRRVALATTGFAVSMLAAAYAAVPLYKLICQVTGIGGTTQRADRAPGAIGETRIRVKFDGNVHSGLPWEFRPIDRVVEVRLGETAVATYEALNRSVRMTTGTATFNVTPEIAGKYFSKIECFCFTEQQLAGGQKVEMPVTFFVDPAIANDPDGNRVAEITLSYTFFAAMPPRGGVAQQATPASPAPSAAAVVR